MVEETENLDFELPKINMTPKKLIVFLLCFAIFMFSAGAFIGSESAVKKCNEFIQENYAEGPDAFFADLNLEEGVFDDFENK